MLVARDFRPWENETLSDSAARRADAVGAVSCPVHTRRTSTTRYSAPSSVPACSHPIWKRASTLSSAGSCVTCVARSWRSAACPDHVHLLLRYRADLTHSELLQQIKGRSSKWINETFASAGRFSWQEGYGGFTVSKSAVPQVEAYIARQKEHHKRQDFRSEFLNLLRKHGVEFDEREVFK